MSKIVKITGGTIGTNQQGATSYVTNKDGSIKHKTPPASKLNHSASISQDRFILTSSFEIEGNLNFRNTKYRKKYNSWLNGNVLRTEMGHELNASDPYSDPPTWTNANIGINNSFVSMPISSSLHEQTNLNGFLSGVFVIETGSLSAPFPRKEFYSKNQKYITSVYKLTGSSDLITTQPETKGFSFSATRGLMFSGTFSDPALFRINVPDRGKIVDIKVWVEFMHHSGSPDREDGLTGGTVAPSASEYYSAAPLGEFWMALRSPNSTGFSSFPLINNHVLKEQLPTAFGGGNVSIWNNSYILWIGRSGSLDSPASNVHGAISRCSTWQRDRHIRTVFCDNARYKNPLHLDSSYRTTGATNHNPSEEAGSPSGDAYGADYPWMGDPDDDGISGVSTHTSDEFASLGSSPPRGWLNGPGGTAAASEWPTTGSNYGADYIKPVYPLLDNVVEKTIKTPGFGPSQIIDKAYEGYRPGLRGTEMNGVWELVVVNNRDYYTVGGGGFAYANDAEKRKICYFRQFRLEITYEKNLKTTTSLNRFKRGSVSKGGFGGRYAYITGSSGITYGALYGRNYYSAPLRGEYETEVYSVADEQPGMTFGITDNTGSSDFAVFSKLTGSIETVISGSQYVNLQYKFLNNEFGTPLIPLNSGSDYVQVENQNLIRNENSTINDLIGSRKNVTGATNIKNLLNKTDSSKTRRQMIERSLTGSI